MYVPIVPNTHILNRSVNYSDSTIISKDNDIHLEKSFIMGVSEYSLESCLKLIFESNPDVYFDTVQYSRKDQTVSFYADRIVNTAAWYSRDMKDNLSIDTPSKILEEVKKIIGNELCLDKDAVSLYDVLMIVRREYDNFKYLKNDLEDYMEHAMGDYTFNLNPYDVDFDFENEFLEIAYNNSKAYFEKVKGDLRLVKSNTYKGHDMIGNCGERISEDYDKCLKYRGLVTEYSRNVKCVNCGFVVNINSNAVELFTPEKSFARPNFGLSTRHFDKDFEYECNSNLVVSAFRDKECELFKRIFVRIDDCPKWMRKELFIKRQEQVRKEEKRQAIKGFVKKLNPFKKK